MRTPPAERAWIATTQALSRAHWLSETLNCDDQ